MVKYVRLLESNPDGTQAVSGIFYVGDGGVVVYRLFGEDKPIPHEKFIELYGPTIWAKGQTHEIGPEDGEEYLEALHFAISGTYLRATEVMEDEREHLP